MYIDGLCTSTSTLTSDFIKTDAQDSLREMLNQ